MRKSIRSRMLSLLAACAMLAGAAQAVVPAAGFAAENLISNSTFENGTADWGIYKESGGAAKLSTEDGKLAMKITDRGTKNYAVQLFYDIIPLYQNATYKFTYEISCDKERYVEAMIQQNRSRRQNRGRKPDNKKPAESRPAKKEPVTMEDATARLLERFGKKH